MSADIINLTSRQRTATLAPLPAPYVASGLEPARAAGQTATDKNQRLRNQRRVIWERVEAIREYWDARYEFDMAVLRAQNKGAPEGGFHPAWKVEDHKILYAKRDEETMKQLLTPGYDLASVEWKRRKLARWPLHYTTDQKKKIEKLIAADLAFLAAHPTRRDRGSKP